MIMIILKFYFILVHILNNKLYLYCIKQVIPAQQPVQKKREEAPIKKEMTEEPRRRTPAPDTHQIFIGNLPSSITEKDVRDNFNGKIRKVFCIFMKYENNNYLRCCFDSSL